VTDTPSALASIARYARAGFLMSGGDTNIAVSVHAEGLNNGPLRRPETLATVNPGAPRRSARGLADEPPMSSSELAAIRAIPRTPLEHVKAVGLGLTVVFVPISMLQGLGIVNFSGGRGILPIADVDTVFQAVMVLTFLGLIWTRRAQIGNRLPFVMFCLTLAGATAILLGYVVTNYGTLFRMRPMIAMPLALAMVALSTNARRR
jgi:hypothetical protein